VIANELQQPKSGPRPRPKPTDTNTDTNKQTNTFKNQVQTDLQKAKQEMDNARQRYKANKRLAGQNTNQLKKVYEATVDKFLDKLKPYLKKEKPLLLVEPIWVREEDGDVKVKELDRAKSYNDADEAREEYKEAGEVYLLEEYDELLNLSKEKKQEQATGLASPNKKATIRVPLDIPEYVTFRVHKMLNQAYYDLEFSKLGEDEKTLAG